MTAPKDKVFRGAGDSNIEAKVDELFSEELSPAEQGIRAQLEGMLKADIRNCYDQENNPLPVHQWPEQEAQALVRITQNKKTGNLSIQLADPLKAAEQLAKLDGMYENTSESRDPFTKMLEAIPRPVLRSIMGEITRLAERDGVMAEEASGSIAPPVVSRKTMAVDIEAPQPENAKVEADADLDVI